MTLRLARPPLPAGCDEPQVFQVDEAALGSPNPPLRHVSSWSPDSGEWRLTVRPQGDTSLGEMFSQQPLGPLLAWRRKGLSGERRCLWRMRSQQPAAPRWDRQYEYR